ncbi:uncharacterized protein [Physcomitrium patens]|uniref:uncharacterized protein n=1 Tax=Physcomitrium patens TaxID=3218 RepID=UPI003CCE01A5
MRTGRCQLQRCSVEEADEREGAVGVQGDHHHEVRANDHSRIPVVWLSSKLERAHCELHCHSRLRFGSR